MLGEPIRDAALVARLLNHPDIRPTIERRVAGPLPGEALLDEPRCHVYAGEHGFFAFACLGDDEYLAHVGLLRRGRGVYGINLGREAFAYLFGPLQAHRCFAQAPVNLPQVAVFAKRLGFKRARLDPVAGIEHLVKGNE